MQKYAIIVAGGAGTRMGGTVPKQFQLLKGKPVLWHTLKAFTDAFSDITIILVLPAEHLKMGEGLADAFPSHRMLIATGGETRFQSVKNGLERVDGEAIIFVHDGVRCLVTKELIHRCYEEALVSGTAIPVVPSKDSIRLVKEGSNQALDRSKVMLVQTPQTFHSKILIPAYQIDYKEKFTDEATVVEAFGMKVSLVEGEENNVKITRPVDLLIAEQILGVKAQSQ